MKSYVETKPISETAVQEIAAILYGRTPSVHRYHSEESRVYRLDFGDALPDKVLKVPNQYAHIVTDEQIIMRALTDLGMDVPSIEFTQDDYPQAPCPFTAMPLILGRSLEEIYQADRRAAFQTFERIGKFTASLAKIPLEQVPGIGVEDAWEEALAWWEARHSFLVRHSRCCDAFERVFQQVRDLMETPPSIFGHRGGVQLITDGGATFTVIDWRDGGATWPHADLGTFLFGLKGWQRFWRDDLMAPLLNGYLGGAGWDRDAAEALHVWEAYQALATAMYLEEHDRLEYTPQLIEAAEAAIRAGTASRLGAELGVGAASSAPCML